jgi:hypothetical protein
MRAELELVGGRAVVGVGIVGVVFIFVGCLLAFIVVVVVIVIIVGIR